MTVVLTKEEAIANITHKGNPLLFLWRIDNLMRTSGDNALALVALLGFTPEWKTRPDGSTVCLVRFPVTSTPKYHAVLKSMGVKIQIAEYKNFDLDL